MPTAARRTPAGSLRPGSLWAMSEQVPERTGVAAVDAAIDAVEALSDVPVSEHAAAFSAAHDALRRALDADPEA